MVQPLYDMVFIGGPADGRVESIVALPVRFVVSQPKPFEPDDPPGKIFRFHIYELDECSKCRNFLCGCKEPVTRRTYRYAGSEDDTP